MWLFDHHMLPKSIMMFVSAQPLKAHCACSGAVVLLTRTADLLFEVNGVEEEGRKHMKYLKN